MTFTSTYEHAVFQKENSVFTGERYNFVLIRMYLEERQRKTIR